MTFMLRQLARCVETGTLYQT